MSKLGRLYKTIHKDGYDIRFYTRKSEIDGIFLVTIMFKGSDWNLCGDIPMANSIKPFHRKILTDDMVAFIEEQIEHKFH